MRSVTVSLFIAVLAAGAVVARAAQDDNLFSLGEGRFEISGRAPRGFAEFRYLYLEGTLLRRGAGGRVTAESPASVKGELYRGRRKFRIKRAGFEGERFTFETAVNGGVSFQFDGAVSGMYAEADQPLIPVFKGRLVKLVNGKKAAEAQVTFGYLEPEF